MGSDPSSKGISGTLRPVLKDSDVTLLRFCIKVFQDSSSFMLSQET